MSFWVKGIAMTAALAVAMILGALPANAQAGASQITFTKDVLPIIQENCQTCHRPKGPNLSGMVAPMSFMTYKEVRPWAKAIAREVETRSMPPWFASEEHNGQFELERRLADEEIKTFVEWVNSGARRGNPQDAPEPVEFASAEGWIMGEPDMVLPIPEPYWVDEDVEDIQPSFATVLTDEQLNEGRWIHWIEFRPGSEVVHHGGARVQALGADGELVVDPISGGKIIGTAPGDGPDVWP